MQVKAPREGFIMGFENGYLINIVIRSRFIESECRKHDEMPFPSKYSINISGAFNQSAFASRRVEPGQGDNFFLLVLDV